jgi:hypothetical protein
VFHPEKKENSFVIAADCNFQPSSPESFGCMSFFKTLNCFFFVESGSNLEGLEFAQKTGDEAMN